MSLGLSLRMGLSRRSGATTIAMTAGTNTSVADQGGGVYRVTKTGGGAGWNVSAVSASSIAGDFVLKVVAVSGNDQIAGVADVPGTTEVSIDFGIYANVGTYQKVVDGVIAGGTTGSLPTWIWRVGDTTAKCAAGATLAAAQAAYNPPGVGFNNTEAAAMYAEVVLYTVGSSCDVAFGDPSLFA
jgi:hypothetical protein